MRSLPLKCRILRVLTLRALLNVLKQLALHFHVVVWTSTSLHPIPIRLLNQPVEVVICGGGRGSQRSVRLFVLRATLHKLMGHRKGSHLL